MDTHAQTAAFRQVPRIMEAKEKSDVSCNSFLREEGNLCVIQANLTEEKQTVSSETRRTVFRCLPGRQLQQSRFECRIPVSKPKFLTPPSGRLIVGRYIRANPSYVF